MSELIVEEQVFLIDREFASSKIYSEASISISSYAWNLYCQWWKNYYY